MAHRFKNEAAARALGHQVRAAREKAGYTVQTAGKMVGVHHSSVSRTELGQFQTVNPSVQKICTFFRLTPEIGIKDSAALLLRLQRLSAQAPDVIHAVECLLDAIEARCAAQGSKAQR